MYVHFSAIEVVLELFPTHQPQFFDFNGDHIWIPQLVLKPDKSAAC